LSNWSIDIIRQSGWDLWILICGFASLVLVVYAIAGKLWTSLRGWLGLAMIGAAVAGTGAIVIIPGLHNALLGMGWTFCVLALLSITFYCNLVEQLGKWKTVALLGVRLLALAMVVPMLFEPVLRFIRRPAPEKPLLILVDTSGSMSVPDIQNGPTRIQSVWQTLRPELERIKDHFIPMYGVFDSDFRELKKPDELSRMEADGKSTDLVGGISKFLGKTTKPSAAVILLSDGIDNTSPKVAEAIAREGRRVHTVSVGSDQAEPATMANVTVENVETADDFVVGHETKVKATIKSSALSNRVVDVRMAEIDLTGKNISSVVAQKLVLQAVAEGQIVELPYKPKSVGVHRLAVWIDPIPGQRTTVGNRQEFQGLALDPRIKVLYIEGRARPEYKDLTFALGHDSNIELATLERITPERFTAARTVDGEPFTKMPSSLEQWKKFDVLILGDLDASFLNKMQQEAVEQFVAGGGGLIMLGGQNSFGPGGYQNTPIEKTLPVFCGDTRIGQEMGQFVPRLTEEGIVHPAMEGMADWFGSEDKKGTKDLPPLRGNVVVGKPKSGAQVLLTHPGRPGPDGQPQTVLAVQRYGQGRSAALTVDTTYLWYLPLRGMGQDSPYNSFWGQIVRWLAGEDVRNRQHGAGIEGLLNKNLYQLGESVKLRAMVRDDKGDATRYAQVAAVIKHAGESNRQIPLGPSDARTGMYEVIISSPDKGDYTLELSATKDGKPLGKQQLTFTVIPPAEEMLKIAANPALMAAIAKATNGYNYKLDQLHTLLDALIAENAGATNATEQTIPLVNAVAAAWTLSGRTPGWDHKYDLPMQAALVVALLSAEWITRRRWQLP